MTNLTPKETLVLEICKKAIDFYGGVFNNRELRIATEHYLNELEELKRIEEMRRNNANDWLP